MGQAQELQLDDLVKDQNSYLTSSIRHKVLRSSEIFGNILTSIPLLKELSKLGMAGTGTVCQNRLNKVAVQSKILMENENIE